MTESNPRLPLDAIRQIAQEDQADAMTMRTCEETTKHVRNLVLPWSLRESGHYLGPDRSHDTKPYVHWWLRLEDGSIVDPTANQFGGDVVRVIKADDERQAWYVLVIDDELIDAMWGTEHPAFLAFEASRRRGARRASWP